MKIMTARDAKNRFGEFLDASRREPVIITKNDRPVGVMISIEDAAETILPELLADRDPGYDDWLFAKVRGTLERIDGGTAVLHEHETVTAQLARRLADKGVRRDAQR